MTSVRSARPGRMIAHGGTRTVPGGESTPARLTRVKLDWTPPEGMTPSVTVTWAAFYRAAMRTYGVTPQFYRDMYVAQHGTCYICRKASGKNPDDPQGRGGRRLGIDHNHVTGAVRGLLCAGGGPGGKVPGCNWIIGVLTSQALARAVEYVETEPAQIVKAYRAGSPDATDAWMRNLLGLS